MAKSSPSYQNHREIRLWLLLVGIMVAFVLLYNSAIYSYPSQPSPYKIPSPLESVLKSAAMEDGTVIMTSSNQAWSEPGSLLDLFLESFKIGNGTQRLLRHLVIVSFDQNAYDRCLALNLHCYQLETKGVNFTKEASFRTSNYQQIVWTKIEFLTTVLELGYNFVFTDSDIMWLQDPFKYLDPAADFQVSSDRFTGNATDLRNAPNTGFQYVRSNPRTVNLYRFWYNARVLYPEDHDQDVFNKIKKSGFFGTTGIQIRFLNTAHFGGFCEAGPDFHYISTMHANCCVGLQKKVHDLKLLLSDWNDFLANPHAKSYSNSTRNSPQECRLQMEKYLRDKALMDKQIKEKRQQGGCS